MYYPLNWLGLISSILVLHLYGLACCGLFFPSYLKNKLKNQELFTLYFSVLAIGFTSYALIGYLIDITFGFSVIFHILILISLWIILIGRNAKDLVNIPGKLKKIFIDMFANLKNRNEKKTPWNIFIKHAYMLVVVIYTVKVFQFSIFYFSLSMSDPIINMSKILLSLQNNNLSWSTDAIGLLNWADRHYPMGFYLTMVQFLIYSPENLFFFIKWFGPTISLLTFIQLMIMLKKLTKNDVATLVGAIVWGTTYIIIIFSTITVSSLLGLFLCISYLNLVIENNKLNTPVIGFIAGGAILAHPFTGGVFVLFGLILNYLYEAFTEKSMKNLVKFIIWFLIACAPYIFLFRYPQLSGYLSVLGLSNPDTNLSLNILKIMQYPLSLSFDWNYSMGFGEIETYGPPFYLIIFSLFGFFKYKSYQKHLPLILGTLFVTLAYIFNPIVINGASLRTTLSILYLPARMNFILGLVFAFLASFATLFFQSLFQFILEKVHLKRAEHIGHIPTQVFLILLLINQSIYTFDINRHVIGGFWYSNIPGDYTETMLWLYYRTVGTFSVATTADNFTYEMAYLDIFYECMAPNVNFNRSKDFYQTPILNSANWEEFVIRTSINQYTYFVVPVPEIGKFQYPMNNGYLVSVFVSTNYQYYVLYVNATR